MAVERGFRGTGRGERREIRIEPIGPRPVEPRRGPEGLEYESVGELIKRLGREGAELARQEIALAKLELKENASAVAGDLVKAAVWGAVAAVGALVLVAFLVMVVGLLLDGAYWAGALIVGLVFLLLGGLLARKAIQDLKSEDVKPDETIQTLKQDGQWLRREAKDFRRDLAA